MSTHPDHLTALVEHHERQIATLDAANQWQCERLKEAEEALRFYADESHWFGAPAKVYPDSGKLARLYFAHKWDNRHSPPVAT